MVQRRILLAEDDTDHQRVLLLALANARQPVDVCVVANRREFIDAIKRERFDCVVMDYHLASDTAPEVLRMVRSALNNCPVVVISSSRDQEVVIESMREGTADFLPKEAAVQGEVLWNRIDEAIRKNLSTHADRRRRIRRERRLLKAAETDPLTGLRNRRYLDRIMHSDRFRRDRRRTICVVMADVDHFKWFNDTYGHEAGDCVLRHFAKTLRTRAAKSDSVARWGGEEFIVLKPSSTLVEGWRWAEHVRSIIGRMPTPCGSEQVKLTASFGVVCVPTQHCSEEAISLADQALYAAKRTGRNCVRTWEMVAANEDALKARQAGRTPEERRLAFLHRIASRLGPTQMEYLGPHCELVSQHAERVGRLLEMKPDMLERLRLAGLLHDIGKAAIPERILAKAGPLSSDERAMIDLHGKIGAEISEALDVERDVVALVRDHHIRHDAEDQNDDMSLSAGVLNAVDALVAMTSPRVYRSQRTNDEAINELERERGRQFAPEIVDAISALNQNRLAMAA